MATNDQLMGLIKAGESRQRAQKLYGTNAEGERAAYILPDGTRPADFAPDPDGANINGANVARLIYQVRLPSDPAAYPLTNNSRVGAWMSTVWDKRATTPTSKASHYSLYVLAKGFCEDRDFPQEVSALVAKAETAAEVTHGKTETSILVAEHELGYADDQVDESGLLTEDGDPIEGETGGVMLDEGADPLPVNGKLVVQQQVLVFRGPDIGWDRDPPDEDDEDDAQAGRLEGEGSVPDPQDYYFGYGTAFNNAGPTPGYAAAIVKARKPEMGGSPWHHGFFVKKTGVGAYPFRYQKHWGVQAFGFDPEDGSGPRPMAYMGVGTDLPDAPLHLKGPVPVEARIEYAADAAEPYTLGKLAFHGRTTFGVQPAAMAEWQVDVTEPTHGAENAVVTLKNRYGGELTERLKIGQGIYDPGAAGGDMGNGSLNVRSVFINGDIKLGEGDTPPDVPTGLAVGTQVVRTSSAGTQQIVTPWSWTANAETDLAGYVVALKRDDGGFRTFRVKEPSFECLANAGETLQLKVLAHDKQDNVSDFCDPVDWTVTGDTTVPGPVTAAMAPAPRPKGVVMKITPPADANFGGVAIYVNTVGNPLTATLLEFVHGRPGKTIKYRDDDPHTIGDTLHYWAASVNQDLLESSVRTSLGPSVTYAGVAVEDLDPTAPATPASAPTLSQTLTFDADGTPRLRLQATVSTPSDASRILWALQRDSSGFDTVIADATATTSQMTWVVNVGEVCQVKFKSVGPLNVRSAAYSPTATRTISGDTTPPAGVLSGGSVTSKPKGMLLEWTANPSDADFAGLKIYRYTSNAPSSASFTGIVTHKRELKARDEAALTVGATYFYFGAAVDSSGNESATRTLIGSTVFNGVKLNADLYGEDGTPLRDNDVRNAKGHDTKGYNRNPTFQRWSGAIPDNWTAVGSQVVSKAATSPRYGDWGLQVDSPAAASQWLQTTATTQGELRLPPTADDYYVIEYEVTLNATPVDPADGFRRAGVWLKVQYQNASTYKGFRLALFDEHPSPVIGSTYAGAKVVANDSGNGTPTGLPTEAQLYIMSNWGSLSGGAESAKTLTWHRLSVRKATREEIRAAKGFDDNGDLARDLTPARKISSQVMTHAAGGTYAGELDATKGATVGTNLKDPAGTTLAMADVHNAAATFAARKRWAFKNSLQGFTVGAGASSLNSLYVTITCDGTNQMSLSQSGLSFVGADTYKVRCRLRPKQTMLPGQWTGRCLWTTSSHGLDPVSYRNTLPLPANWAINEWRTLEWDMSNPTVGGSNWIDNAITGFTLDFVQTSGFAFEVAWIAIGDDGGDGAGLKGIADGATVGAVLGTNLTDSGGAPVLDNDALNAKAHALSGYNRNPTFQRWIGGSGSAPDNYIKTGGPAVTVAKQAPGNLYGSWALRITNTSGNSGGVSATQLAGELRQSKDVDYLTFEWEVGLVSGDFVRAGLIYRLYFGALDGAGRSATYKQFLIDFNAEHPSTTAGLYGEVKTAGVAGTVGAPLGPPTGAELFLVNADTLLSGAVSSAKTLDWHKVVVRKATKEEIKSLKAINAAGQVDFASSSVINRTVENITDAGGLAKLNPEDLVDYVPWNVGVGDPTTKSIDYGSDRPNLSVKNVSGSTATVTLVAPSNSGDCIQVANGATSINDVNVVGDSTYTLKPGQEGVFIYQSGGWNLRLVRVLLPPITSGLGTIAGGFLPYGTAANTAAQGNDSRITGAAQVAASNTFSGARQTVSGFLCLGMPAALTIVSDTVTAATSSISVDTEGGAASDNLSTINGGSQGDMLLVKSIAGARVVTLKDGVGNLVLAGDMVLDNPNDRILLIQQGGNWVEISRSNNA